jgi:methionyl-tRNA formyltransferase
MKTKLNYVKNFFIDKAEKIINNIEHIIDYKNFKIKKLRIIFMGTPDIAVPFLETLVEKEKVIGVFTAPDMPAGRYMKVKESAVKQKAKELGLRIFQPNSLKDAKISNILHKLKPDLILIVAYGYLIPEEIINIPKYKSINIHFSLLPKYRGAAPINWALIKGEKETGVSSFFLTKKLDDGDIIVQKSIEILDDFNSEILAKKLTELGQNVLENTLKTLRLENFSITKQNESLVSFAPKLKKLDGKINWNSTSSEIYNKIRGLVNWPGAYSHIDTGDSLRIIKLYGPKIQFIEESGNLPGEILDICKERGLLIKCGYGAIWIQKVQLDGHKIIHGYEFFLGRKIQKGDVLES